ncbi:hypothetical protein [Actinokineospora bangkokensis]|uniref:Uncharacterized protein n=1 Tax=Actinokineospora bangkokensis TaxID=1193682 RepID=A0A1Q9LSW2_9PSEU|nr:hypothetical protein [Actinokineospora bangkokensis]OLR95126.1 hypothetical protein BJP25_07430 [Actinokineospora bangkokensis]
MSEPQAAPAAPQVVGPPTGPGIAWPATDAASDESAAEQTLIIHGLTGQPVDEQVAEVDDFAEADGQAHGRAVEHPAGPPQPPGFAVLAQPEGWQAPSGEQGFPVIDGATAEPAARRPWGVIAVGGALAIGVASFTAYLLVGGTPVVLEPDEPGTPTAGAAPAGGLIELDPPVDRGGRIELSWRSDKQLDYAVILAAEGQEATGEVVGRVTSATVEVDPTLRYCVLVQGTDAARTYESRAIGLRGATCRK